MRELLVARALVGPIVGHRSRRYTFLTNHSPEAEDESLYARALLRTNSHVVPPSCLVALPFPDDDGSYRRWIEPARDRFRPRLRNFRVSDLLAMIDTGKLDISNTSNLPLTEQWGDEQETRVIESMLLRIPLPALYFHADAEAVFQVVNGQRCLDAIRSYVRGVFPLRNPCYLAGQTGASFTDLALPLRHSSCTPEWSCTLSTRPSRITCCVQCCTGSTPAGYLSNNRRGHESRQARRTTHLVGCIAIAVP